MDGSIMAFDLGRTIGVAVLTGSSLQEAPYSFVREFKQESHGETFFEFSNWVSQLIKQYRPSYIVWEEIETSASYMSKGWMRLYFGMRSILLLQAELWSTSWIPVTVNQIKKEATGNGNAKKQLVLAAALERWPDNPPMDHNDADARFAAVVAHKFLESRRAEASK